MEFFSENLFVKREFGWKHEFEIEIDQINIEKKKTIKSETIWFRN